MTSLLKKGLRGAASVGAELSMEQYRANLDEKKMARLQQYQTGERKDEQAFRTSERVAGQQHDLNMQKLQNEGAGGGQQGDIQLMNYFQEHGIAKNPQEALNLVREMDTDPSKVIIDIAKSLHTANPDLSFDQHLQQAENDVKSLRSRLNPPPAEPKPMPAGGPKAGKGIISGGMSGGSMIDQAMDSALAATPPPSGGSDTVKIQTDDDYMKLTSGTRYVAPDGKVRVKK